LSRKDLSNLFGVSKSQIARIVRGEHWIDAGRM
jgi:transcriptional regulator with XRE-family HTH domain